MNRQFENEFGKAGWRLAFVAIFCSSSLLLRAGDAIFIPSDKVKIESGQESMFGKDLLKRSEAAPSLRSLDAPPSSSPMFPTTATLDPKRARQLRNQRLEQKNWMFVEQGELQSKDGNNFGIRDDSLDNLEKPLRGGDLTFREMMQRKASSQTQSPNVIREREDSDSESRKIVIQRKGEPELGAHTASELNLRNLLGPDESFTAGPVEKSDWGLREFLSSGVATARAREQQPRRDASPQLLNSPRLAGPSDPINFSTDLTRQPLNPVAPQPLDPLGKGSGQNMFAPIRDLGHIGGPSSPLGFGELNSSRISGFSSLPLPTLKPAESPRNWQSGIGEPPRRPF